MTAVVVAHQGKAQAIDKVLKEPLGDESEEIDPFVNFGYVTPDVEWPDRAEKSSSASGNKGGSKAKNEVEKEEDIYGYGYAAPTPKLNNVNRVPRRSSLKGGAGGDYTARRSSIGYTGEMTLVLPDGKKTKRRTSITFDEEANNSVRTIESIKDLTKEPRKLWFQKSEYVHIQRKVQEIIKDEKKSGETTRGLESLMDRNLSVMDRREAMDAVLDEQSNQKLQNTYDPNFIKDAYSYASMDSSIRAQERAIQDTKEVETYLHITRKMCRRMSC